MNFRPEQFNAFAAASMDRTRREGLLSLNQQGFEVTDGPGGTILVRDAAGHTAKVESLGLRVRIISPEGRATEIEQYASGRIERIVDPSGREVRFERDPDGFLQSIDRGAEGGTYRFQLSPDWKPLRVEYPDGTATLADYTSAGQPSRIVHRDGSEIRYEYMPDGRLTALTDPHGSRTQVSYEGRSRVIDYPNGARHSYLEDLDARLQRFEVNGELHAVYRYDPEINSLETLYRDRSRERFRFVDGLLVEAANEHATVKLEYDDAGRLLSEETNGQIVRYLRNETGSLVGLVTPKGDKIAYSRDRDQRLTGIRDWTGAQYGILLPPSGPPTEVRYPNGVTVRTSADAMGALSAWSVHGTGLEQQQLDSASWRQDTCDRLLAATRDNRRRDYEYDHASRLTAVRCSDAAFDERFHLDSRGNRVQSGEAACTYDQMNQLLSDGSSEFSYDRLGNQTGERDKRHDTTYSYNGRGQLVGIQDSWGLNVEYTYDALGRRIRKRVGSSITHYQWAGARLLSESTDDGQRTVRRDYLFCPEFLTPLAFREGSELYYMHCGRLHEPLCVTDRHGQIAWKAEYLAFGTARVSMARVRQPWRLPGQYLDEETGLHYSVARYYSPAHGRFLSMDPQRLPGASLNYYTYCDGDPVNRVDPTGEISLTLGAVLIGIGIGIAVGAAIGAGVELYKQRNQETDWGQVGLAAVVGGCLGGISGAIFVVGGAALAGTLGVVGAGAAAGAIAGAVEYCVTAVGQGEWDWGKFGISVGAGAAAGAVTAGIGGIFAGRAARRIAQEAADRAAQEAADRAAQEAADRAAQEAADKAAREALERSTQDAADAATQSGGKGQLSPAGRALTKHAKGQRAGSQGFPEIKGNQEQINEQASEIMDGILHDPNRVVKVRPGKGGEEILQVNRPDGTGAIFKKVNGQWVFSHFAENLF